MSIRRCLVILLVSFLLAQLGLVIHVPQAQALSAGPAAGNPQQVNPAQNILLFLPNIMTPPAPASGVVTMNNGLVSGVPVYLYYYNANGRSFSLFDKTSTNADGFYNFPKTPYINTGDYFYIYYPRDRDGALDDFYCNSITANARSYTCNFDITDIPLGDPGTTLHIFLPYTFHWTASPFTTDNYTWELYSIDNSTRTRQAYSQPLGYTNQVTMQNLPGISVGKQYYWGLYISRPQGAGHSHLYSIIYFNNH